MAAKPTPKLAAAVDAGKLAANLSAGNVAGAAKSGLSLARRLGWKKLLLMSVAPMLPVVLIGVMILAVAGAKLGEVAAEADAANEGAGIALPEAVVEAARSAVAGTNVPWQLLVAAQFVETGAGGRLPMAAGVTSLEQRWPSVLPPVVVTQDGRTFAGLALVDVEAAAPVDPNRTDLIDQWMVGKLAGAGPPGDPVDSWFAGTRQAGWQAAVGALPLWLPSELVPGTVPAPSCTTAPNTPVLLVTDDVSGDPGTWATDGLEVVSVGSAGLEAVAPLLAARTAAGTAMPARVVVAVGAHETDGGKPADEIAAVLDEVAGAVFVRPHLPASPAPSSGAQAAAAAIAATSGALDATGWPAAAGVTDSAFDTAGTLTSLGLSRWRGWLTSSLCPVPPVAATSRTITRDELAQRIVATAVALTTGDAVAGVAGATPSAALASALDIPAEFLALYVHATQIDCPGLRWEFLAAIGQVETNHGRSKLPGVTSGENRSGAAGPMQFMASTWKTWGTEDPNDRFDPKLAIPAAARFFCALGAVGSDAAEAKAASDYNAGPNATGKLRADGDGYARKVADVAARYADQASAFGEVDLTAIDTSSMIGGVMQQVQTLVTISDRTRYSQQERFSNSLWNTSIPWSAEQVLDCSSFAAGAYRAAGVELGPNLDGMPFNAQTRSMVLWGWATGRVRPEGIQPGDWVFTRAGRTDGADEHAPLDLSLSTEQVASKITLDGHVAVWLGGGKLVDANVASGRTLRGADGSGIGVWPFDPTRAVVIIRPFQVIAAVKMGTTAL